MDHEPTGSGGPEDDGEVSSGTTGLPENDTTNPLAAEAAELRGLIDSGAGSPEELRALAARLREHREREEELWRAQVRPELMKSKKRRHRVSSTSEPAVADEHARRSLLIGLGILAVVLIVVIAAANTSPLLLVLPVVGVLVYAYVYGRGSSSTPADDAPPDGTIDTLGP